MKVKRILSSIMAAVMVATSLVAVNVSNVWAADLSAYVSVDKKLTNKRTYTFTGTVSGIVKDDTLGSDITVTVGGTSSNKIEISSGVINMKPGSVIDIVVPPNSAGKIWIEGSTSKNAGDSTRDMNFEGTTSKIECIKGQDGENKAVDFAKTVTNDGKLTVTSAGDCKFTTFVIELTEGTYNAATEYVLTGDCSGLAPNTEFKLGDYTATVDAGGKSYTIKIYEAVDTKKVNTASGVNDVVATYGNDAEGVKFSTTDNKNYVADVAITFTKPDLGYLTKNSYTDSEIIKGLPNFEFVASNISKRDAGGKICGDINFKLDSAKKVTINAKCGTSDENKWIEMEVKDSAKSYEITDGAIKATKIKLTSVDDTMRDFVVTLPAGDYTLSITTEATNATTLQVSSIKLENATVAETPEFNVTEITRTGVGEYIVVGKFTGNTANYDKVGIRLGKTDACNGADEFSTAVYGSVTTGTYSNTTGSLFAVLVTGVNTTDTLYAKGYTVSGNNTVEQAKAFSTEVSA